ncbi:hypothetical protein FRC12_016105 [Ceratobasidium sp. 428]|nr:hypothetical protein FRC12_016105 [Ceratobasidium sp. 428]
MAPSTRSSSKNNSNPGNARIHSGPASTSTRNPPLPEQTLKIKCEKVLHTIKTLGLTFGQFILAVSYGEDTLRDSPGAVEARGTLYSEDILSKLLELCLKPPLPPSGGGPRPAGGTKVTEKFIFAKAKETFRSELTAFCKDYRLSNSQLSNADYITTITSDSLHEQVKRKCPELYSILSALTVPRPPDTDYEIEEDDEDEDELVGPHKPVVKRHPNFDIMFQISSMAYRLNPLCNTLQKILTVYLHGRHTAKPVIDLFQQGGQSMSYSWVRLQVSNLSAKIREETILAVRVNPFVVVHDNIRLKYPVRSQRGNNQTVTDNGTASAVIISDRSLPSAQVFRNPDEFRPLNRTLQAQRRMGTAPRLCYDDLSKTAQQIYNRESYIFDVLEILATTPELYGLKAWKSDKLKRPVGPNQLPSGPEHRLKQYMLPTTNIDESLYSGNSQFVPFALKELGFDTEDERTRLTLEILIAWIGDRMTVQRCRQVQAFLQETINGYARWDSLLFIFGGLHCMMALGSSLLEHFRGSNIGATFGADIILLSRTGLQKQTSGKPDHHTVDEFLQHELSASIRGLFDEITGCDTSESRMDWAKTCTDNDLYNLAERIVTEHASSGALELDESDDELRKVIIQRQRDLLLYHSLRRAFKYGDVDRIEAILPELLYYFIGAGNGQYADEVYVFLQLLSHETTPALKVAILQHALVVNNLGRPDSFYPIDQRQELNNKGIREYGPPPQNSSWEQYGKISRVIPFYTTIIEHVDEHIAGISRSHVRKEVKAEMDIQALMKEHQKHRIHTVVPGRTLKTADKTKDAQDAGLVAVRDRGYLEEAYAKRAIHPTPPPSPVPPVLHNEPTIFLDEEDILSQSTETTPSLEDGISPQDDDPAVEALMAGVAGMGLGEAH